MQTSKYTNTLSIPQSKDFSQEEERYSKGKKAMEIWLIDFKRNERREFSVSWLEPPNSREIHQLVLFAY